MSFWISIWAGTSGFFNSNFFVALATILTIGGAIYLYLRQKSENRQQIARLLINEIRNAEDAIQELKDRQPGIDLPEISILPQNSWNEYSHLFSKDLDQDEMHLVNRFYSDAERANYIVRSGNTIELLLLQTRERSKAIHKNIIQILARDQDDTAIKTKLEQFKNRLQMPESLYHYSPQGFGVNLDKYLQSIHFVLETPAGDKLKKIAKLRQ